MLNIRYLSRRETVERSPDGADPKTGSGVSSRGLGLSVIGLAVIDDLGVLLEEEEEEEEGDEDGAEMLTSGEGCSGCLGRSPHCHGPADAGMS